MHTRVEKWKKKFSSLIWKVLHALAKYDECEDGDSFEKGMFLLLLSAYCWLSTTPLTITMGTLSLLFLSFNIFFFSPSVHSTERFVRIKTIEKKNEERRESTRICGGVLRLMTATTMTTTIDDEMQKICRNRDEMRKKSSEDSESARNREIISGITIMAFKCSLYISLSIHQCFSVHRFYLVGYFKFLTIQFLFS